MIKVGINGFGRIGRLFLRRSLSGRFNFKVVAINTSGNMEAEDWAHLFKYDSSAGSFPGRVETAGKTMIVDHDKIMVLAERDPEKIPWDKYGVDLVVESTGVFREEDQVRQHLRGSVKRVLLTAPAKGGSIPTFIYKINDDQLAEAEIWNNASCTTNCIVPVMQVIEKNFGIVKAMMTTVHAYTSDQRLLDNSHRDLRRSRSAAINIIPTTTGAAQATAEVLPELKNIFDGIALRVPVATGSITDITCVLKKKTTKKELNKVLADAAKTPLYAEVLAVTEEPLVSSDIVGNPASAIIDLGLTRVVDGDLVKIMAWYDNEWGYVSRLVDQVDLVARKLADEQA